MKTNEQRIKLDTQQAKDAIELHLRREVERICDNTLLEYQYNENGKYWIEHNDGEVIVSGPYTLPELHDKLKELEKGD